MTESVLIIGMRSNQMSQSHFKTLILDLNTRKVCNLCTLSTDYNTNGCIMLSIILQRIGPL